MKNDDLLIQLVIFGAAGATLWLLWKKITETKIGAPGGLAGAVGDLVVGARPDPTEITVPQPNIPSVGSGPAGPPVLAFPIDPRPGSTVHRQDYRQAYPFTIDIKNMSGQELTAPFTFDVFEGSSMSPITTTSQPFTLQAGQRKQITVLVDTDTLFAIRNARAQVRFGGTPIFTAFYVIS